MTETYISKVLNNEIVTGRYIKLACKRFYSFLDKYDYRQEKVDRVVNFIQSLKHFQGKSAGKPFILEPWQVFFISNVFGFYEKGTDKRVCNTAVLEISRKNGKSAFASAIMLYMLMADGERGSEVDCLANSRTQAGIIFEFCKKFARSIDKNGKYVKQYRDSLLFPKNDAKLQTLASDSSNLDGYSPYCAVLDEIHEYKDSKLVDVMVSGQGFRDNPLTLLTTTAGFNLSGYLFTQRKTWIDILEGNKTDDHIFPLLFELDEGDNWKDENNWIKSNPNLNITVSKDYIQKQVTNAINSPSLEVGVKTKNLNIFCSSSSTWLSHELIARHSKKIEDEFFVNRIVYCGVDLSAVSDLTAFTYMTTDENGIYYFKTKYYLPESCLYDNPNATFYQQMKREGHLCITPGNVVDYDYLKTDILRLRDQDILIEKVSYDQYNATQFAISCTEEGLPLEPYPQALWSFNRPTKEFERLLKSGKIVLDHNPITNWCFENATLKIDHCENVKPIKAGDNMMKIDGTISILESLGGYLGSPHYNNEIMTI